MPARQTYSKRRGCKYQLAMSNLWAAGLFTGDRLKPGLNLPALHPSLPPSRTYVRYSISRLNQQGPVPSLEHPLTGRDLCASIIARSSNDNVCTAKMLRNLIPLQRRRMRRSRSLVTLLGKLNGIAPSPIMLGTTGLGCNREQTSRAKPPK